MWYEEDRSTGTLSIVEAIETLSSIAELELDSPIAIAEKHELAVQNIPISFRTVHWMHKKNAEKITHVVKGTFRTILNYLRDFYKKEVGHLARHESVESIKTIMVLVGEAAKKLDKFSRMLSGDHASSVKETKEFRELYAFYQRKIAPIAAQESLSKSMKMLPVQAVIDYSKKGKSSATLATEHLFVDLESVKNDNDYELFFIRKEDGSRFFSPRLLKSIKLVCNFEEYFGEGEGGRTKEDSYQALVAWQDDQVRGVAKNILRYAWRKIDSFVKDAHHCIDYDLAMKVYNAISALMLAACDERGMQAVPQKTAYAYFSDFQKFLRQAISSHDYQRMINYPPEDPDTINFKLLDVICDCMKVLFEGGNISKTLVFFLDDLIAKGKDEMHIHEVDHHLTAPPISHSLSLDYEALLKGAKPYSHAPLVKVLDTLQDFEIRGYDPLLLQMMPSSLFDMSYDDHHLAVLRLASPTYQEYINKAHVTEEFKGFLRALKQEKPQGHLLMFNLQDRTSWKEYARSAALEEIQKKGAFEGSLSVVTQSKDSDFYNQVGPYQDLNQTDIFIDHLLEHVASESSGYFYPEHIKKALFSHFAKGLARNIWELFFTRRNVLSRNQRMDFIELFYLFMQLKIIDVVKPDSVAFTCKDGIDIGMSQTIELFLLLKLINDRPLSHEEEDFVKVMLFALPLVARGRNLFSERFTRLNSLVKLVEATIEEDGIKEFQEQFFAKMKPLFESNILNATFPRII